WQPLILFLDDVHWADPASLDLLRFVSRSIMDTALLIIATYRSDELSRRHPLYTLVPLLVREAAAQRLNLDRLDDDAVRALVHARYRLHDVDANRLVQYLQARAEGNALFLRELLRSLEEARMLDHDHGRWVLGGLGQTSVPSLLR